MKIDSHQHFWHYEPARHGWIDETMSVIQRDFLPSDLAPILKANEIEGCVAVQADQTEEETHFLLKLAEQNDFIKAVVGWVDLRSPHIEARLEYFSEFKKLAGFRHVVQGEADHNFLLREKFTHGIQLLEKYNFTYDILVFPYQLGATLEFVKKFPNQKFVIDHLAKPYIKDGYFEGWAALMREIAKYENVSCKISGMVTEADWATWTYEDLMPYMDLVGTAFGPERMMYGSDWPVCLVASSYEKMYGSARRFCERFTEHEQEKIFGLNAWHFYTR